ncbi:MAG TPA: hypothetical protein VFS88_06015, partial [Micavibrio sp.]|nr:hypothetical protein [Micavibrio sp.]
MTDPSGIKPIAGNPAAQAGGKGQVVQIVSLPEGLESNARAIRLQGEVVRQNQDGTVRVNTPEGAIDIQVRGRQPQAGQRIEIDIPPGNPPKQANIRPAPAQAPPPAQPPATPQTPAPAPASTTPPLPQTPPAQGQPAPPPPATSGTTQPSTPSPTQQPPPPTAPADNVQDAYIPSQPKPAAQTQPPLPPLTPGQTVKLAPYIPSPQTQAAPPAPSQAQILPDAPIVQDNIVQSVSMRAGLAAQKTEGNLITTLLNAVKSALPPSVLPQGMQTVQNAAVAKALPTMPSAASTTPVLQPVPSAFFEPVVLNAKILSLTLPSGQVLTLPNATQSVTPSTATIVPNGPMTPQQSVPSMTVTVTELTPQQQPIIQIPMDRKDAVQNFFLQAPPASVPVGTQITLQPQPAAAPTSSAPAPTDMPDIMIARPVTGLPIAPSPSQLPPAWRALLPLMQPASLWPAMDELFQTFYQATPAAAQIMGRIVPSPGNPANFGPAVLLFIAAIKAGDLQAWMGDKKLEMVQKLGKESLLSRLSGETSSLAGNNDAPGTDWKSFPVPILWQNEISKIMLHVRKEPSEKEQQEGDGGTRFVMDLALTRMGDVQIDGLVRGKQLDLILRTQMPISASMQDAMRVAYARALDGTDIFGDIGFQSDRG